MITTTSKVLNLAAANSDEDVMAAVRTGSRDAFEELFERYRQPLWAFFRRRVREPATAEDLLQNVFAALLEAAPRYQARGAFRSYLFGIAYNLLKAERRKDASGSASPLDDALITEDAGDSDRALWVRSALARLDPDARELVMLREYDGLSYQEIAEVRRLPVSTVKTRLFRARMALRTLLSADAGGQ